MAGINMINIDAGKVDKASATVVKQLKNIQGLAKFASRKSIMTWRHQQCTIIRLLCPVLYQQMKQCR